MIKIAVFCEQCGRKTHRSIDPDLPPSSVRCRCGAQFDLKLSSDTESKTSYGSPGGGGTGKGTHAESARAL